jgi:hypothetical protein
MFRADTPAVHPDFTAAKDAVDVAFRDAFQNAREVVVYALRVAVLPDFVPGGGIFT